MSPSESCHPARPGWGRPRPHVPKNWARAHPPGPSQKPRQSNQIKPNQTSPPRSRVSRISRLPPPPISEIRDPSRWPSARTKAKTPVIVHHQGKSRLIKASAEKSPAPWSFPTAWRLASGISSPVPFATLRLRAFALKTRNQGLIKAQSRQKPQQSRLIVLNQASSRQTPDFRSPPAPMECGGMTPLWNRETCLPVDRATPPARGGDGPIPTFLSIGQVPIRPLFVYFAYFAVQPPMPSQSPKPEIRARIRPSRLPRPARVPDYMAAICAHNGFKSGSASAICLIFSLLPTCKAR